MLTIQKNTYYIKLYYSTDESYSCVCDDETEMTGPYKNSFSQEVDSYYLFDCRDGSFIPSTKAFLGHKQIRLCRSIYLYIGNKDNKKRIFIVL